MLNKEKKEEKCCGDCYTEVEGQLLHKRNCPCHQPQQEEVSKEGKMLVKCPKCKKWVGCIENYLCLECQSSPESKLRGSWEEEFYARFPINEIAEGNTKWGDYTLLQLNDAIIDFISKAISQAEERGRNQVSNYPLLDRNGFNVDKAVEQAREEGRAEERKRLQKVAQEYKDKGFELETFIYSGFLEPLEDLLDKK